MNFKAILLVTILVVVESRSQIDAEDDIAKMTTAINSFGLRLYKKLAKTNPNLMCSGYGVATVLNMLLTGARNHTEKELRDVLGYNAVGLSKQQAEVSYHEVIKKLRIDHTIDYALTVLNSVLIHSRAIVLPTYTNDLQRIYYTSTQRIDFQSPTATNRTNAMIRIATNNRIPKFFDDPIDLSTSLILVSALYFRGTWQHKFNPKFTTHHPFSNGHSRKDILFMETVNNFPYYENKELGVQVLELPFEGRDTSVIIVLPRNTTALPGLENKADLNTLQSLLRNLTFARVHVRIPKLASFLTFSLQLNDVLKSLGIKNSFSPSANFTGIESRRGLFLSKAIQKTVIEVTEDDVTSAAASATLVKRQSGVTPPNQVTFIADRPFHYAIQHRPTGVILFLGRLTEV